MAPNPQEKQRPPRDKQDRQKLNDVIAKHLLQALGQPSNLQGVQVRRLWENHYRVNILTGADAASLRIARSFFLVADGDGNILESTPQIARRAAPAATADAVPGQG